MTIRLTQLMQLSAVTGDTEFRITELFHDPRTLQLRYAALDIGGWLSRHEVLVALDRFGPPDPEGGGWPLALTRAEVEEAPVWTHDSPAPMPAWPPLVVGPFGGTYAPFLVWSQAAEATEASDSDGSDEAVPSEVMQLEQTGDWIGRECFADAGALGRCEDLELTEKPLTIAAALVTGGEGGRRLPMVDLAYFAEQGHAVFRVPDSR